MSVFEIDNSVFYSTRINNAVVLEYRQAAFALIQDVAMAEAHMKLLEAVDKDSEVRGLVVINDMQFDEAAGLQKFLEYLQGGKNDDTGASGSFYLKENAIARFRNLLGQRMLLNLVMTKVQIAGFHGDITSEYLGIVLPFDARFATPDTRFNFSNARLGFPVTPGVSYFLPRFVGQGKALDLIQNESVLTAEDALSLGLIKEIVPHDQLQARCLEEVDKLAAQPAGVAAASRMLINPDVSEFEPHLERYFSALTQALHKL